jgi:hypothetical protein
VPVSGRFGRFVGWISRCVTVAAVVTQAVLLGIDVAWGMRHHTAIVEAAGRQGGLFGATVLLTALVFWLTARIGPGDPLPRLRRSEALRLAAIHATASRPRACR